MSVSSLGFFHLPSLFSPTNYYYIFHLLRYYFMMTRLSLLSIALAVAASPSAVAGFTASNHQSRTTSTELSAVGNNRRNFLSAVTGSVLVGAALPAWAEISQGTSLPQGAQQFSTMIRVKGDLKVSVMT